MHLGCNLRNCRDTPVPPRIPASMRHTSDTQTTQVGHHRSDMVQLTAGQGDTQIHDSIRGLWKGLDRPLVRQPGTSISGGPTGALYQHWLTHPPGFSRREAGTELAPEQEQAVIRIPAGWLS